MDIAVIEVNGQLFYFVGELERGPGTNFFSAVHSGPANIAMDALAQLLIGLAKANAEADTDDPTGGTDGSGLISHSRRKVVSIVTFKLDTYLLASVVNVGSPAITHRTVQVELKGDITLVPRPMRYVEVGAITAGKSQSRSSRSNRSPCILFRKFGMTFMELVAWNKE